MRRNGSHLHEQKTEEHNNLPLKHLLLVPVILPAPVHSLHLSYWYSSIHTLLSPKGPACICIQKQVDRLTVKHHGIYHFSYYISHILYYDWLLKVHLGVIALYRNTPHFQIGFTYRNTCSTKFILFQYYAIQCRKLTTTFVCIFSKYFTLFFGSHILIVKFSFTAS